MVDVGCQKLKEEESIRSCQSWDCDRIVQVHRNIVTTNFFPLQQLMTMGSSGIFVHIVLPLSPLEKAT